MAQNAKLHKDICDPYYTNLLKRGYVIDPRRDCMKSETPTRERIARNSSTAPQQRKPSHRDMMPVKEPRRASITRRHYNDPLVVAKESKSPPRFKSRNRSVSPNTSGKSSWDKLLTVPKRTKHANANVKLIGSFSTFDPLRTLHFLGTELKDKLRQKLPDDKQVQQMIVSMQQALSRLPQNIYALDDLINNQNGNERKSRVDLKQSQESLKEDKPSKSHVSCQTPMEMVPDIEALQKQLEASTQKLENSCKQMEELSGQLTSEKEELQLLLRAEKETVRNLHKHIETIENAREEEIGNVASQYQREIDELQKLIDKLSCDKENSASLKEAIANTKEAKQRLENDFKAMAHQYSMVFLERDKLKTILKLRERQINEIRSEMDMLQEVVSNELKEMIEPISEYGEDSKQKATREILNILANKDDGDKNPRTISSIDSEVIADLNITDMSLDSNTSIYLRELQMETLMDKYNKMIDIDMPEVNKEETKESPATDEQMQKDSVSDLLFKSVSAENSFAVSEQERLKEKEICDKFELSPQQIIHFQRKVEEIEKEIFNSLNEART